MKVPSGKTVAELQTELAKLPPVLTSSFNLGMADVYPATSGKVRSQAMPLGGGWAAMFLSLRSWAVLQEKAAEYIMQRWEVAASSCALLCDDDNDLGLAAVVARVFCPNVTAVSRLTPLFLYFMPITIEG